MIKDTSEGLQGSPELVGSAAERRIVIVDDALSAIEQVYSMPGGAAWMSDVGRKAIVGQPNTSQTATASATEVPVGQDDLGTYVKSLARPADEIMGIL